MMLIQRFLLYSINPYQYWVAIGINLLVPILLSLHLILIGGWDVAVGGLMLGLLAYTFGEYAFHRWIAHGYLVRYMDVHHADPQRMFTTPWFAAPAFVLIAWSGLALVSPAFASGFFLGAAVLHLYADVQHYLQHHTPTRHFLTGHHLHHHQRQMVNFGLTTRLWDYLLGTLERPR